MDHNLTRPPRDTPRLYAQDGKGYQATVHAHYWIGATDWLVTEYDPGDDLAFGWCRLNGDVQNQELGYTDLAELESIQVGPGGVFRVDYELDWTPIPLRDAIDLLDRRQGRAG